MLKLRAWRAHRSCRLWPGIDGLALDSIGGHGGHAQVSRAAAQVGLDQQLAAAAEARAIDLQVLHDPLDVIARLGDRDALDPVDRIDLGIARIAVGGDPLLHAAAAGIVAGEGQDVGAAVIRAAGWTVRPRPSACCRPDRSSSRLPS